MLDNGETGTPPTPTQGKLAPAAVNAPALRDPYTPMGYPADSFGGEPGFAQSLQKYIHIVLRRKWLILGSTLVALALGTIGTLMQTPRYTATVRLQIDSEAMKVVEDGATAPREVSGPNGLEFLRTQWEVLKSRGMSERVVSALHLSENTDFLQPQSISLTRGIGQLLGSGAAPDAADLERHSVEIVAENIKIRPVTGSRLVDLSFTDPSPTRAQQIATAYADAYVASTLDKRFEANAYAKTFLEDQIKQLKIRLEASEQVQLDFAQKEKIIEVNEKTSVAESNLAAANVALGQPTWRSGS